MDSVGNPNLGPTLRTHPESPEFLKFRQYSLDCPRVPWQWSKELDTGTIGNYVGSYPTVL